MALTETKLLPRRRKIYAHKVRTGCETCKKRHLKCDESKPSCLRCVKASRACVYNVPKPRLFEISGDDVLTSTASKPDGSRAGPINIPNTLSAFTDPREGASLHYYLNETGPWLTRYTPREKASFWTILVPRYARSLPATRHLLMALVGIEQRFFVLETSTITARANEIVRHYNAALKQLSQPKPHPLDLLLAPILCWMIELMTNNPSTARMHIDAAQRILDSILASPSTTGPNSPSALLSNDTETAALLPHLNTHYAYCRGYSATSAACGGIFDSHPITLVQLMSTRYDPKTSTSIPSPSSPITLPTPAATTPSNPATPPYPTSNPVTSPTRTPAIRAALHTYLTHLNPQTGHTTLPPSAALRYLRFWEHAIWCRRFATDEATETVVALTFLVAVISTLLSAQLEGILSTALPTPDPCTAPTPAHPTSTTTTAAAAGEGEYTQSRAFGYILLRFEDLLDSVADAEREARRADEAGKRRRVKRVEGEDRRGMYEAVGWGLELMERFAVVAENGGGENRRRARGLLGRVRMEERDGDGVGGRRGLFG